MLKIDDLREEDEDEYKVLGKLAKRINQLRPTAKPKDRDDQLRVRFPTKAVEGTK